MSQHVHFPWISCTNHPHGLFSCRCSVCGAASEAGPRGAVDVFVAAHRAHQSAVPTHYGAGDVIAGATRALGIKPCTPCEARRRTLNGLLPRVWRR